MKALSSSKKPTSKFVIGVIAVIVLISAGVYAYLATRNESTDDPQDTSTIKQEQAASNSQSKSPLPSKDGNTPPQANPSDQPTPSTPPEKPTIERAGGSPVIKVVATLQKSSSGHCELQLSQPGQQMISFTSAIVVSASYYSCSFTLEKASLPSGTWSASVIHHIGTASTRSDAKEIE